MITTYKFCIIFIIPDKEINSYTKVLNSIKMKNVWALIQISTEVYLYAEFKKSIHKEYCRFLLGQACIERCTILNLIFFFFSMN